MTTKRPAKGQPVFVAEASVSTKAYRSTAIQWGLVSLQVDLFSSLDSNQGSARSQWVKVDDSYHQVGVQTYDKITGDVVNKEDIVKGVLDEGKVILVSDEELKLQTEYGQTRLVGFLDAADVYENPVCVFTHSYQVRPSLQKVGRDRRVNQQAEHLFDLLRDRLKANGVVAVLEMVMQDGGSAKEGILDHNGVFKLIAPQGAVRQEKPLGESPISPDEAKMVDQLIKKDLLSGLPPHRDDSYEKLMKIVELKKAGKSLPAAVSETKKADDQGDLMSLLQASLKK